MKLWRVFGTVSSKRVFASKPSRERRVKGLAGLLRNETRRMGQSAFSYWQCLRRPFKNRTMRTRCLSLAQVAIHQQRPPQVSNGLCHVPCRTCSDHLRGCSKTLQASLRWPPTSRCIRTTSLGNVGGVSEDLPNISQSLTLSQASHDHRADSQYI